jgi:hypothetical protein
MRQLLMLGFYCEVYRREPLCRIYINDVLVDEFNIPQSDRVDIETDVLDPLDPRRYLENFITNPPFIKYIEFDDADADSLDVLLEIQNDDNNYTNGFMSRYTHITLSHLFLISKKVLENINTLTNNFKFSQKNWEKYKRNIVDYYANNNRNQIFGNLVPNVKLNFPDICSGDLFKGAYKIGSSGHYCFTLEKKLGFWRDRETGHESHWRLGPVDTVKYFYDKYKQHEDQRSSNT